MPSGQDRAGGRSEFGIAYSTKESGRTLQKKLRPQLADVSDSRTPDAAHGEDGVPDLSHSTPREDRAG
ncbi:MAG: hypothetical protein V4864_07635 [Pseudomonadota bacterium]